MAFASSRPARHGGDRAGFHRWLALAALIVVVDQLTKRLVTARLAHGDVHAVTPWLDIVLAYNRGAAFSMLSDAAGWQRWLFAAVAIGASALIVVLLRRHAAQALFALSITLILGGALGNLVDRLLLGHVVDFVQVHARWLHPLFRGGYFPAFNVADAAITAGAIGLLLDELRRVRRG